MWNTVLGASTGATASASAGRWGAPFSARRAAQRAVVARPLATRARSLRKRCTRSGVSATRRTLPSPGTMWRRT